ncbi:MAG: DUF4177 domain-containing protein [candidate division WOR-3 bacterium]|nr:DUF4177 domain-containing protein [candidate division WOR-3 bacterium]
MTRWEYKFVQIDINLSPILRLARWGVQVAGEKKARETMENVERYITELGAEGWELVAVVSGSEHTGIITRAILFLKRPIEDASAARSS